MVFTVNVCLTVVKLKSFHKRKDSDKTGVTKVDVSKRKLIVRNTLIVPYLTSFYKIIEFKVLEGQIRSQRVKTVITKTPGLLRNNTLRQDM